MPLSKIAFIRSAVIALLLGMAALLGIVGATLWLVGQARTYTESVTEARQQRTALVDLRGLLQDAETGQRGYLLTGNRDYLEPYTDARQNIASQIDQVRLLVANSPGERASIEELITIVTGKLAELQQTIDLFEADRRDESLAIVNTNRGRELMDQARDIIGLQVMRAEDRISSSLDDQQTSISALRWVTLISALFIMLVVGGSAWMVVVYTRQLIETQREVQALNIGLEERVHERTANLNRANEEIQRFAYIVTHDLRAPLVNIMGFTSELEASLVPIQSYMRQSDEGAEPTSGNDPDLGAQKEVQKEAQVAALQELPEAISFIRSSTRKMDGLINAILKLSREGRRTLKPERIELTALLENAAASVRHQVVEAGGTFSIEGDAPTLLSDRLALEQIFGNLFDNAVKYRVADRPLQIHVRVCQEVGQRVLVEVEDNGRGIAPQDHERIFDLFRRSGAQDQPGEGIGLAHVRTMIRNLGGEITVNSELTRGTTMMLNLPPDLRKVIGVVT
jgi:signal transduction histidine kinase